MNYISEFIVIKKNVILEAYIFITSYKLFIIIVIFAQSYYFIIIEHNGKIVNYYNLQLIKLKYLLNK